MPMASATTPMRCKKRSTRWFNPPRAAYSLFRKGNIASARRYGYGRASASSVTGARGRCSFWARTRRDFSTSPPTCSISSAIFPAIMAMQDSFSSRARADRPIDFTGPAREANPGTFYSALSNVDIVIEDGNPGAVAVRSTLCAALLPCAHGLPHRRGPGRHP